MKVHAESGGGIILAFSVLSTDADKDGTLEIGYCDYHPVTHISACDTILPVSNLAKNAILLL